RLLTSSPAGRSPKESHRFFLCSMSRTGSCDSSLYSLCSAFPSRSFSRGHLRLLPKESNARQKPTPCRDRRDWSIALGFTSSLSARRSQLACSFSDATRLQTEQRRRMEKNQSQSCRSPV